MLRSRTGKKLAVLIGSQLDVYSRVQKGKKISKKKREQSFMFKANFFREGSHKPTKKSSAVLVQHHSGQCPVQYMWVIDQM